MPDSPFFTVEEVAELLRVPLSRVYEWTRQIGPEALPRYKAGRRFVFLPDEVLAWFTKTQRVGTGPSPRSRRHLRPRVHRVRPLGMADAVRGPPIGHAGRARESEATGASGPSSTPSAISGGAVAR